MATPTMESTHSMTNDEIITKLVEQLSDEVNDSNLYYKMAKSAHRDCDQCDGRANEELARALWEISLEEYTHAKFIHGHLTRSCIAIPEELGRRYQTLRERAETMYEPEIHSRISHIRHGF